MSIWPLPFEFRQGSSSIFFTDVPLVYKSITAANDIEVSWFWTLIKEVKYELSLWALFNMKRSTDLEPQTMQSGRQRQMPFCVC